MLFLVINTNGAQISFMHCLYEIFSSLQYFVRKHSRVSFSSSLKVPLWTRSMSAFMISWFGRSNGVLMSKVSDVGTDNKDYLGSTFQLWNSIFIRF
jgi:hypothetical protein